MTETIVVNPLAPDQAALKRATTVLKKGGVVAYPTETFYALGVDACNSEALENLFKLKKRPLDKPVSVIIADSTMLAGLVSSVPTPARQLMKRFWPGPLTLVFPGLPGLPPFVINEAGGVAVRISSHPLPSLLVSLFQGPITATSANVSGQLPPTNVGQVYRAFGDSLDLVLDAGETEGEGASTLLDLTGDIPRIVREEKIKAVSIFAALKGL